MIPYKSNGWNNATEYRSWKKNSSWGRLLAVPVGWKESVWKSGSSMKKLVDGFNSIAKVARYWNFCYICSMRRKIIAYGRYYKDFLATLTEKEIQKVKYVLSLLETEDRLPIKFIKSIRDGLYELRMSYNGNIYPTSTATITLKVAYSY